MKITLQGIYSSISSRNFSGAKFFLICSIVLLASCKKESDIGSDVQPDSDLIDLQYSDSLTLFTHTVKEDSLRSDESGIVQIGELLDPVFGKTNASLFTQIIIPNNLLNINFGTGAVLDSCALSLAYDYDFYGDTLNSQQTFSVYQLTEDLYKDSVYYSNQVKQCYPSYTGRVSVGDTTLTPHPRSRTIVGTDTGAPVLRIPIDYAFAQNILAQSNGPNLASNSAFLQYMKGLYIESTIATGTGALLRFNLTDTNTKFTLYYHNATDTVKFSFVINSTTAYYSNYKHDYTSADPILVTQLNNPGVATTTSEVYVSGCSGVKTKIEFPYLEDLRNLGYAIAINKAELVIKADPLRATDDLPINTQFYVVSIDSTGTQILLTDMFENSLYFGGSVNTTNSEYHINIARYFQQLMAGEKQNNGLYLKEFDPNAMGRRAVLGSGNPNNGTNNYKMYLHLVYTRIN